MTLIAAMLFTGGYAAWKIVYGYRSRSDALVRFASAVRAESDRRHLNYGVVGGREEGMLLYLRKDYFLSSDDAAQQWRDGKLDALVVRDQSARDWTALLPGAEFRFGSGKAKDLPPYSFFVRR
jgi:hypothetical protein